MIDYETFTVADGCAVKKDLTLSCLLNEDLTDSFAVSENLDNQSFTVQSSLLECAAESCKISPESIENGILFSIQSKHKAEMGIVVKCSQSSFYKIIKHISNLVSITIMAFEGVICKICRHIKRNYNNMKGRQNRSMVYTLRLLRL